MQSFTGGGGAGGAAKGAGGMNPYLMAASGALEGANAMAQYQMQKRMYNRDKQRESRDEFQQMLDRTNAQRRRVGESATKGALLKQMAMRLGLGDIPFNATQELQVKPSSGTTRVDKQFNAAYGANPAMTRQPIRPAPQSFPQRPRAGSPQAVLRQQILPSTPPTTTLPFGGAPHPMGGGGTNDIMRLLQPYFGSQFGGR